MTIKPLNNEETMQIKILKAQQTTLRKAEEVDPDGVIPNGVFAAIKGKSVRLLILLIISCIVFSGALVGTLLNALAFHLSGIAYIAPSFMMLFSLYKGFSSFFEKNTFDKSVKKYREDLKIGLNSTPPFISRMYLSLHKNQIQHIGFSVFFIFYVGLFTLIIGFLKDVDGGIFHFKLGIDNAFHNPVLMSFLMAVSLVFVAVFLVVSTVHRKKRILDIESFYGESLMSIAEIEKIKTDKHKFYRRLFIVSVLVTLVMPILIASLIKGLKRRK